MRSRSGDFTPIQHRTWYRKPPETVDMSDSELQEVIAEMNRLHNKTMNKLWNSIAERAAMPRDAIIVHTSDGGMVYTSPNVIDVTDYRIVDKDNQDGNS